MPVAGWRVRARGGSPEDDHAVLFRRVLRWRHRSVASAPTLRGAAGGHAGVRRRRRASLDVADERPRRRRRARHASPILSSFDAAFSGGALSAPHGCRRASVDVDVAGTSSASRPWRWSSGSSPPALSRRRRRRRRRGRARCSAWPPRALWAVGAIGFCALRRRGRDRGRSAVYVASRSVVRRRRGARLRGVLGDDDVGRLVGDRLTTAWGWCADSAGRRRFAAAGVGPSLPIGHPPLRPLASCCSGGDRGDGPSRLRAAPQVARRGARGRHRGGSTIGYFGLLVGRPSSAGSPS